MAWLRVSLFCVVSGLTWMQAHCKKGLTLNSLLLKGTQAIATSITSGSSATFSRPSDSTAGHSSERLGPILRGCYLQRCGDEEWSACGG